MVVLAETFSLVSTLYASIYSITIIGANNIFRCSDACLANPICGGFSFQDEVCRIVVYSEDGSAPREVTDNVYRRKTYRNKRILSSGGGTMIISYAIADCNNIGGSLILPATTLLEKSILLIRDTDVMFVDLERVGLTDVWKDSFNNEYHTTDSSLNWMPGNPYNKPYIVYADEILAVTVWSTSPYPSSGLCLEN